MDFNDYQAAVRRTKVYPEAYPIIYPALGLAGETGELVEKVKKMVRDDGGELTNERREAMVKEAGDVLWYLTSLVDDLGMTLERVAEVNVHKLTSRRERGVLKGDGDDR